VLLQGCFCLFLRGSGSELGLTYRCLFFTKGLETLRLGGRSGGAPLISARHLQSSSKRLVKRRSERHFCEALRIAERRRAFRYLSHLLSPSFSYILFYLFCPLFSSFFVANQSFELTSLDRLHHKRKYD
jgi:hypothetical protein